MRIKNDSELGAKASMKSKRDAEREQMRADMKKKAKKAKGPAFEVLDVTEAERGVGEKVDAYRAKKQLEARALEPQEPKKVAKPKV